MNFSVKHYSSNILLHVLINYLKYIFCKIIFSTKCDKISEWCNFTYDFIPFVTLNYEFVESYLLEISRLCGTNTDDKFRSHEFNPLLIQNGN